LYITRALFTLEPMEDVIIPPFSTKVSKTILIQSINTSGSSRLLEEIYSKARYKSLVLSPVFSGSKPLMKLGRLASPPLTLFKHRRYWFSVAVLGIEPALEIVDSISSMADRRVDLFNRHVRVSLFELSVRHMAQLGLPEDTRYIKLQITTPMLLQLPPRPHVPVKHILFPMQHLMVRSLLEHWNMHAGLELAINDGVLPAYAFYALREVDYEVVPVTVIYDESRRPRGFIGWLLYHVWRGRKRKRHRSLLRLLDYANYVGIGRSRTMGFGIVSVRAAERHEGEGIDEAGSR